VINLEDKLVTDIMENFLQDCRKKVISKEQRSEVIKELLRKKNCTQRQLAEDLGMNYSTLHDWVSLRQNNNGDHIHISFITFIRKIKSLDPKTFNDWGRIKQLEDAINELKQRKNG